MHVQCSPAQFYSMVKALVRVQTEVESFSEMALNELHSDLVLQTIKQVTPTTTAISSVETGSPPPPPPSLPPSLLPPCQVPSLLRGCQQFLDALCQQAARYMCNSEAELLLKCVRVTNHYMIFTYFAERHAW